MARYRIRVSRTAERQIKKLPLDARARVARSVQGLAIDPFPGGCRKLTGYDDVFRVRAGPYRILYSVNTGVLIVIVLKVGHRRNVYR
ncbi:MAG: type II toxin-antitoxin system RelE/ParE family toxin [Acidobacteriota bacterium]|nr:type II toxin-antitoxin system RelE/ParE family toxin [Acidobacteriota bacterium]